jgi:hypothetical protein
MAGSLGNNVESLANPNNPSISTSHAYPLPVLQPCTFNLQLCIKDAEIGIKHRALAPSSYPVPVLAVESLYVVAYAI